MNKKQKEEIKKFVQKIITTGVLIKLQNTIKNIVHKAQDVAYHTEKKLIQQLFAVSILFCGLIFLIIGLTLLINNIFKLQPQWGFIIMGGFMIIIALIFISYIRKTRVFKFN